MGRSLDEQAEEYKHKINEVYSIQVNSLEKSKLIVSNLSRANSKIIPVYSYLLFILSSVEDKIEKLSSELLKTKFEQKLFSLIAAEQESREAGMEAKITAFLVNYAKTPCTEQELKSLQIPQFTDKKLGAVKGKLYSNIISRISKEALLILL